MLWNNANTINAGIFSEVPLADHSKVLAEEYDIELVSCGFTAQPEQLRRPRKVRLGLFQHALPVPPSTPIKAVRTIVHKLAKDAIEVAASEGVNVFCFQEAWSTVC